VELLRKGPVEYGVSSDRYGVILTPIEFKPPEEDYVVDLEVNFSSYRRPKLSLLRG